MSGRYASHRRSIKRRFVPFRARSGSRKGGSHKGGAKRVRSASMKGYRRRGGINTGRGQRTDAGIPAPVFLSRVPIPFRFHRSTTLVVSVNSLSLVVRALSRLPRIPLRLLVSVTPWHSFRPITSPASPLPLAVVPMSLVRLLLSIPIVSPMALRTACSRCCMTGSPLPM